MNKRPGESFWKEYEDKADEALRTYSGPKNPRGMPKKQPKPPLPRSVPGAPERQKVRYVQERDTVNKRFKTRYL
jgi:hypothetical protein